MNRRPRAQTVETSKSPSKYDNTQLTSVSKLLATFISNKQKKNQQNFIDRIRAIKNAKKRGERIMIAVLKGLFSRKLLTYTKLGYMKMQETMAAGRRAERKALQERKEKMKKASVNILAILYKRL